MIDKNLTKVVNRIKEIHDVEYGQTYGDILPFSQHLDWVFARAMEFKSLLDPYKTEYPYSDEVIAVVAYGHDILQDTNLTYNDLGELIKHAGWFKFQKDIVLEAIYNVTDEKGRNRAERKNVKYYEELTKNPLAVYIKLCDMAVNMAFSRLNGSDMYKKYKKEFLEFKSKVYYGNEGFKPLFDYEVFQESPRGFRQGMN